MDRAAFEALVARAKKDGARDAKKDDPKGGHKMRKRLHRGSEGGVYTTTADGKRVYTDRMRVK